MSKIISLLYNIHTCEVCFPVLQKNISFLLFISWIKKLLQDHQHFLWTHFNLILSLYNSCRKNYDNFVIQYSRLFNVKKKLSCTQLVQPVFRYLLNVTPVVDIRQLSRQVVSVGTLKIKHRAGHCAKFSGYRQRQRDNVIEQQ